MYNNKYLKYKSKYLNLKKQIGGTEHIWNGEWTLDKHTHGVWKGSVDSNPISFFTGSIIPDEGNVLLIGSVYQEEKQENKQKGISASPEYGNFMNMVVNNYGKNENTNKNYEKVLFLYNENCEAFLNKNPNINGQDTGGGNGPMRAYNQNGVKKVKIGGKTRSGAIPTGPSGTSTKRGGFTGELTKDNTDIIDKGIELIKTIIKDNKYKYIMYSCDNKGKLGFGIFNVSTNYQDYLNSKIRSLSIHKPIVCTRLLPDDNKIMKKIEEYAIKIGVGIEPNVNVNDIDTNVSYAK